jgi:hypothetical protein
MFALFLPLLGACPGFGSGVVAGAVDEVPANPTYDEHVGPILDQYCAPCHTVPAGGGAPTYFRLDQYGDEGSLGGAYAMRDRIDARAGSATTMPPSGNPAPTQIERDTLALWVEQGAPESPGDVGGPRDTGDTDTGDTDTGDTDTGDTDSGDTADTADSGDSGDADSGSGGGY